eukprot:6200122-Pleurochrysis_carterae.AAC.4
MKNSLVMSCRIISKLGLSIRSAQHARRKRTSRTLRRLRNRGAEMCQMIRTQGAGKGDSALQTHTQTLTNTSVRSGHVDVGFALSAGPRERQKNPVADARFDRK